MYPTSVPLAILVPTVLPRPKRPDINSMFRERLVPHPPDGRMYHRRESSGPAGYSRVARSSRADRSRLFARTSNRWCPVGSRCRTIDAPFSVRAGRLLADLSVSLRGFPTSRPSRRPGGLPALRAGSGSSSAPHPGSGARGRFCRL